MKFIVSRTSMSSENKPCDEAIREYNPQESKEVWVVKIKDLKQLCEFTRKYGDSIVLITYEGTYLPEIEIYDDYRE